MGFHSLAIGNSALLTARYGLDVTGQNLGNPKATAASASTSEPPSAGTPASATPSSGQASGQVR